jgi:hypothetical protein
MKEQQTEAHVPTPVSPNRSSHPSSGFYDNESGQCVGPTADPPPRPPTASGAPPVSSSARPEPAPAAVDQLVKAASERNRSSCLYPVLQAGLTCAGTATAIVIGTSTGAGAIAAAAIGGAACGVNVMIAEDCLNKE